MSAPAPANHRKQLAIQGLQAAAIVAALAGCSSPSSTSDTSTTPAAPASANKTEEVTVAQYGHVFLYMPLYVAADKGFFREEGLDVKVVSTGGDEKTFAAVSSGAAQFGVSDPTFAAIARERGQGGKIVAAVVRGVPFWLISYKPNLKMMTHAEQLKGLRIAAYTAPSTSYAVVKHTLANSGKPIEGKIVEGSFGSLLAILKADKADVAQEIEPIVSIAEKDGAKVVYEPCKTFGDFAFTGVSVTDEYAVSHKETIQKFVKALTKAMRYIKTDFDGAVAVATKEFPEVDPKVVSSALKRLIDSKTIPDDTVLPEQAWINATNLRKELGDLKAEAPFAANVDNSFADSASTSSGGDKQ